MSKKMMTVTVGWDDNGDFIGRLFVDGEFRQDFDLPEEAHGQELYNLITKFLGTEEWEYEQK